MTPPLWFEDIETLGERFRARSLSPIGLTEALLTRVDRLNPELYAFSAIARETALSAARQAEAEINAGRWRGPLHGVPVAVKDLIATKDLRTASGMSIFDTCRPDHDGAVVHRLRAAGAVMIGKLTMTEAAFFEHHPTVTPPRNPWNAAVWTGASSSGAAVALAAGLCFGAIGSDTGGSIRVPCACCGLTGLKPTSGLVSCHGAMPLAPSLDCLGPMARSADGVAAMLAAIVATDSKFTVRPETESARPIIGIDDAFVADRVDAQVHAAYAETIETFSALGFPVRQIHLPPAQEAMRAWATICATEARHAHRATFPSRRGEYGPLLSAFLDAATRIGAASVAEARAERDRFSRRLDTLLSRVDFLLSPTMPMRVPSLAETAELVARGRTERINHFTQVFNLSGHPAISFNAGQSTDGLPVGMQLVGRHGSDGRLCWAVAEFQATTDWHRRTPPEASDAGKETF